MKLTKSEIKIINEITSHNNKDLAKVLGDDYTDFCTIIQYQELKDLLDKLQEFTKSEIQRLKE